MSNDVTFLKLIEIVILFLILFKSSYQNNNLPLLYSCCCCCVVPPNWSDWKPWSDCSVTCGPGSRDRERDCIQDRCPDGTECIGGDSETGECEERPEGNVILLYHGYSLYLLTIVILAGSFI